MNLSKITAYFDWLLLGAVALIILLPKIDFIRVKGTTTSIRVEDFVVAIVYAVWLVWRLINVNGIRLTWVHKLMVLVVAVGALSTIVGLITHSVEFPGLAWLNIARRVEYFGMFVVAYDWLKPERLRGYMIALLSLSALIVVIGIAQFFDLLPMMSTWEGYSGQLLYFNKNFSFLIATFAGHYELGGYLLLMTPLAIVWLIRQKSMVWRACLVLLLIGYYGLLYYSYSRAAYFAMLFELVVLFVLLKKYWMVLLPVADMARIIWLYFSGKFSKYSYSIGVVHTKPTPTPKPTLMQATAASHVAKLKPTMVPTTQSHLKLSPDTELTLDPGGATRVEVWQNAFHHFLKNPVIGTGYSSIGTGADNQYLRTLAETGVVGLASLLGLVGYVMYRFYIGAQRFAGRFEGLVLLALLSGMAGIMGQAVLIDILDSSKVAMLLWFLVGLGLVLIDRPAEME